MACDLDLIVADTLEWFEALEGDVASCGAIHVGEYRDPSAFHAAAREILEAGLAPTMNYYRDPATGEETFSLWYFLRERR